MAFSNPALLTLVLACGFLSWGNGVKAQPAGKILPGALITLTPRVLLLFADQGRNHLLESGDYASPAEFQSQLTRALTRDQGFTLDEARAYLTLLQTAQPPATASTVIPSGLSCPRCGGGHLDGTPCYLASVPDEPRQSLCMKCGGWHPNGNPCYPASVPELPPSDAYSQGGN